MRRMFILLKMAESGEQIEPMDAVDDDARDESEIFISIKTPQDIQKVSVNPTSNVKQVP